VGGSEILSFDTAEGGRTGIGTATGAGTIVGMGTIAGGGAATGAGGMLINIGCGSGDLATLRDGRVATAIGSGDTGSGAG